MGWTTTHDLAAYEAAAGAYVRVERAAHTVLLTVAAQTAVDPGRWGEEPPEYGWWTAPDGAVRGAFLRTPPFAPLLSRMPAAAAAELAALRVAEDAGTPGVNAERGVAEAFAAAWERETGGTAAVEEVHRLYRLAELRPPDPAPPGAARVATKADRDLLMEWHGRFGEDVGAPGEADPARGVDARLGFGGLTLWEVDGAPVSFAGNTRDIAGMCRVAPVYTPRELRGRGYAGAATAAVTRAALERGVAEVLLFTDLANPTSNALYQRLGYRPVQDHLLMAFRTSF